MDYLRPEEKIELNEKRRESWVNFIEKGIAPSKELIRPLIFESWVRSYRSGVAPYKAKVESEYTQRDFKKLQDENKTLIVNSEPYLKSLYKFLKGSGFTISLADAKGVILTVVGSDEERKFGRELGYSEGANWSELNVGTNSIGTSLFTKSPVQIYGNEHYCTFTHQSVCSSAPVLNKEYNPIGVVTISGSYYNVSEHTLGMAVAAANAIENAIYMAEYNEEIKQINAYKDMLMDTMSTCVLALDSEGRITQINRAALKILCLEENVQYENVEISKILPSGNEEFLSIYKNKKILNYNKEILIQTKHGQKKLVGITRVIQNISKGFGGMMFLFEEAKQARKYLQNISANRALLCFDDMVGKNKEFLRNVEIAKRAANSDSTVLLLGESGTGKDVIAQAIHNASSRHNGPFISVNCGAIPKELIGSELFGYAGGAFTGAKKNGNIGKFELADEGTLFLDEIGDMPLDMQINLLHVLEKKYVTRIGGNESVQVDVRIIAATNKNLKDEVAKGSFREDLFYRLNVITLEQIPLRKRKDDIRELCEAFYNKIIPSFHKESFPIPEEYFAILEEYDFPGNIRELQNIIERSVNLSLTGELLVDYIPQDVIDAVNAKTADKQGVSHLNNLDEATVFESVDDFEKYRIKELIEEYSGNMSKVADELKIARSTLYRKMRKYGILK